MLPNHDERLLCTFVSLEGLFIRNGFGGRFIMGDVDRLIAGRMQPISPWRFTDGPQMALSLVPLAVPGAK